MSVRVQIHFSTQFMNFFIEMTSKRSNTAGHYVNNGMRNMILLDMLTASFQCCHIVINCLCRANLRNVNFEAVCIMKLKFMVVDSGHALKLGFIHTTISIGFAGNMIFYIFFVLVVLCEFIYKGLIAAICTQRFCPYQVDMLYFLWFHSSIHPHNFLYLCPHPMDDN